MDSPTHRHSVLAHWLPLVLLILVACGATAGWVGWQWLRANALSQAELVLDNINDARAEQLRRWREERLAAGREMAWDPILARAVLDTLAGSARARADLRAWMQVQRTSYGYSELLLLDPKLRVIETVPAVEHGLDPVREALTRQAIVSGEPLMTGMHKHMDHEHHGPEERHIAVIAPLVGAFLDQDPDVNALVSPGTASGVLVLRKDPTASIEPLLHAWPLLEVDGETLLLEDDGGPRLITDPRRRRPLPEGAPVPGFGLSMAGRPEARPSPLMLPITDLWGRDAYAVTRQVPNSAWRVVTVAPAVDLLAPLRQVGVALLGLVGLASVTLTAIFGILWWRRRLRDLRERFHIERERRELAEALRESDLQLRAFFEDGYTGMAVLSPGYRWLRVNPAMLRILGVDEAALLQSDLLAFIHGPDRARLRTQLQRLGAGQSDDCELDLRFAGGGAAVLHANLTLHAVRKDDGAVAYVLLQLADRGDRIEVDQLYRALIETSIEGFLIADDAGRLMSVNDAYCQMTGFRREELAAMSIADLEGNESPRQVVAHIARIIACGTDRFETRHRCKDGRLLDVDLSTSYSDFEGGRFYVFVRAISERKRTEQALARERAQLRALFDGVDAIIYVADPETCELLYVNDYFRRLFGEAASGAPCYRVLQNRDAPCPFCTNDKIFGEYLGRSLTWDFQNEVTGRWFRCVDKAITWSDGRLVRFELAADITDQREMDQRRIELEKLGSLGQLTAGVAHELNNPLMGVINAVQYCLEELPADHDCHPVLTDAEHHTRRCIGIVQGLLAFSRSDDGGREVLSEVDPRPIVERVLRLLEYRFREGQVSLTLDAPPTLGRVRLQPDRFEQVLVNLLTNALDAVENRPTKEIGITLRRGEGRFLLDVSDSGPGIPDAVRERIFDPFFTTKPTGKGTGLGLSTSWSIVTDHGGCLRVSSQRGRGTEMSVEIPLDTTHDEASLDEAATHSGH